MGASLSKLMQAVSWQTEMGARRRLLCPLCRLSPGTEVPGESFFFHVVCLLERLQGKACHWSVATYARTKLYTKIMS